MTAFWLSLALFGADATEPTLLVPGQSSSDAIRFSISIGRESPDRVWSRFLKHWADLFDTNRNGQLSPDEANLVPPIPNAAGSPIRLDVPAADSNGDGSVGGDELQIYYQLRGLKSVNTFPATHDRLAIQMGEILWELLDQNHDGQLSHDELVATSHLLNRWDRNEDERLSVLELPTRSATFDQHMMPPIEWVTEQNLPADMTTIPLNFDPLYGKRHELQVSERQLPLGLERLDGQRLRLRRPSTTLVADHADASVQRIIAAKQYLIGEINTVRADAPGLESAQIRSEPTLEWLVPLVNVVDADQNDQVSDSEIDAFVELLAEGAAAQLSIAVANRGRNLFDLLDADSDNKLDLRELFAARNLIAASDDHEAPSNPTKALLRENVPLSIVVDVRRGPAGGRFFRLRMPKRQFESVTSIEKPVALPRWFIAMDRNRDQTLSLFEFLGPVQRFEKLDMNLDGVISSDEIASKTLEP